MFFPPLSSALYSGCLQALICVVLLLCFSFFFPQCATLAAIAGPSPSLFLYFASLSESWEGCTHPFSLLLLPTEDSPSENIVYW